MLARICLLVGLAVVIAAAGCGRLSREENIEVKEANDPLSAPRSILKRYAEGQPLGSEVTSFPKLVEDVRKVDPDRAAALEKGFNDIQKAPASARPARAKEVLKKIAPSML